MSIWVVARHELRHKRWGLAAYSVGALALLAMYVAIFPSIQSQAKMFEEVLKNYPQEFLKAFNIDSLTFDTLEKYLAAEQFSLVWPIMAIAIVLSRAGSSIAGEIERGTMGLLLSLPIGRSRILAGKYLAGWVAIVIFSVISVLGVIPIAAIAGVDYQVKPLLATTVLSLLFMGGIFSLAVLISTIFSERSKVYGLTSGLLMIMYVMNVLASLKESLNDIKYGSIFYYFDPSRVITGSHIRTSTILVFGGLIMVCSLLAWWRFSRRDISV